MIRNNRIKIDQYIQYGFWELYQVFLILGLFVCFLYTFVFDPRVGRYEKSKMFVFYQYYIFNYIIIQYNGDTIYVISDINIHVSGKYIRLKKRYLKSLSISIQQHTTLRFNKDN